MSVLDREVDVLVVEGSTSCSDALRHEQPAEFDKTVVIPQRRLQ